MKRPGRFRAVCFLLAGCSSTGNSDYSQFYRAVRQSIAASFGNGRITKSQAAAIPYASMGYRLNDGAEQLLVLATDTNGEQLWTSAAHIVIVTRGGRIVRTVGLPHDVSAVTPRAGQAIAAALPRRSTDRCSYSRLEDFPDIAVYGVALTCNAHLARQADHRRFWAVALSTVRIDESLPQHSLNWSFTDNYWLDRRQRACLAQRPARPAQRAERSKRKFSARLVNEN